MRNYIIDELNAEDKEALHIFFQNNNMQAFMQGIYWLSVPDVLYTGEQKKHADQCGPYIMGLDLGQDSVCLELLVRAKNRMRCSCVAYATKEQRIWAMDTLDTILEELGIIA